MSPEKEEPKLETVDISEVEILATGTWQGVNGPATFTDKDLDGIISSFEEIRKDKTLNYEPPVKLGHAEKQKLLQEDGYPAAGWINNLKKNGTKLVASLTQVPKKIGKLIDAGAYKKVSAEIYPNYEIGGKKYKMVLKAISLLGADVPAVKTLQDIVAQYDDSSTPYDVVIFEESLDKKVMAVRDAYYKQTRKPNPMGLPVEQDTGWVQEVYPDYIIVNKGEEYFKIPYDSTTGEPVFNIAEAVKVERVYQEVKNNNQEVSSMQEKEIRELLKLDEKADILEAIKGLQSKANTATAKLAEGEQLQARVTNLETELKKSQNTIALKERDERVSGAINAGKVLPAQKSWAEEYALKDPTGFDAFVKAAPVVVKLGEIGHQGDEPGEVQLTEAEVEVSKQMGVNQETLIKSKKEEANQ